MQWRWERPNVAAALKPPFPLTERHRGLSLLRPAPAVDLSLLARRLLGAQAVFSRSRLPLPARPGPRVIGARAGEVQAGDARPSLIIVQKDHHAGTGVVEGDVIGGGDPDHPAAGKLQVEGHARLGVFEVADLRNHEGDFTSDAPRRQCRDSDLSLSPLGLLLRLTIRAFDP